ncbi:hypothetical protein J4E86_011826, partial [Alternaria arbusti]|uniref:uncharacterized protein n=1 Tax=Alternaria arbusti TaxID=232088 RepID=UPI00221F280D
MKDEHYHAPKGLAAPSAKAIPPGFKRDERETLTGGFHSEEDEVRATIALRGQGGPRKGRPTNLQVPYKGRLSGSVRAVAQRDKARLRNEEQQALHAAGNADRAAKHQVEKKLRREKSYQAMSRAAQRAALKTAQEAVEQKRLSNRQSVKWLQPALAAVHEKWADAPLPADPRPLSKVLEGASVSKDHPGAAPLNRAALRIYGGGGALELIMRNTYCDGFAKLQANSFKSPEAKKEWTDFVARLQPSELVMVKDEHWR